MLGGRLDLVTERAAHTIHGQRIAPGFRQRVASRSCLHGHYPPLRSVAGGALGLDDRLQRRILLHLALHLGLPQRILGRVGHHRRAPVRHHGNVRSLAIGQDGSRAAVTGRAVARSREQSRGPHRQVGSLTTDGLAAQNQDG